MQKQDALVIEGNQIDEVITENMRKNIYTYSTPRLRLIYSGESITTQSGKEITWFRQIRGAGTGSLSPVVH